MEPASRHWLDRRHGLYECVLVKNLSRLARGEAILESGRKFASAGLSVYNSGGGAGLIPPVYAFYSRYRTEGGPAFGSQTKMRIESKEFVTLSRGASRTDASSRGHAASELRRC